MKKVKGFLLVVAVALVLTGCSRQAAKVSHNVSQEADNFNVVRRVAVINTLSSKVEFEVIGNISVNTSNASKLEIIVEAEKGVYKKHLINMTQFNMYVVEDLEGADVNNFKYEVNYMPESIVPFTITNKD
ncbi:hypothetical protein FQS90_03485 [Enterococcus casseliflavus]|jgi:PBP1b-binding outer membrane lipoprotein LpoB|uniref:beta-sandwich lipoprotein n=1 Tax=Enterococcus sp. 8E11_MSG4843 TaxID=1834190 RepID=UPI000B3EC78A|nr:hypothetical protein [Enterococcus sp. 8E11_MSG4843]MBO1095613.1 hypothetical protein [Enterococcus casseliflavus]MBO1144086.1 hypothetical protein [Enterococcus casseliflavus]OUZ34413.1 hypothetical protein A5885_002144 [Enterococcus sp. 8E11_MSG4843]